MLDTLSQLVRKPSKATDHELDITGWREKQARVLKHMERDVTLIKLLEDFKVSNDRLKFIRSKKDVRIYFVTQEKNMEEYLYARCMFTIDGKSKEFRKYIGLAREIHPENVNMEELKELFLRMLKNYLQN
jgi:hypothetical protein